MKKLLAVLVLLLGLFALIAAAAIVITPRVTRLDPVKVAGDALTGYGANSDRHKNARQLPTPWDPVGDANRRVEAIPMEDRAYPLIAEAAAMLEAADAGELLSIEPGDEGWQETVGWLRSDEAQAIIRLVEQAAAKPEAGFPISDDPDPIWESAGGSPMLSEVSPNHATMLEVLFPVLAVQRDLARVMLIDARMALLEGEQDRFASRIESVVGLTRYRYELSYLIDQVVQYQVVDRVCTAIEAGFVSSPIMITATTAQRAERALRTLVQSGIHDLDPVAEDQIMEEQIRMLVDQNGRFDVDAVAGLSGILSSDSGRIPSSVITESINEDLLVSLEVFKSWSLRAQETTLPPYEAMVGFKAWTRRWAGGEDSVPGRMGRQVFGEILPAWQVAVGYNRFSAQRLSATRLALAAHRHRLRHGDPPLGLADIDDDLITFDPIDGFTGGPMQFRWRDGAPFVYTYGPDKDDDGGRHVLDADGEPWTTISDELLESAPDGDFVLFPSPIE